ncbi:unnamed protein product [Linum grandiflorum]
MAAGSLPSRSHQANNNILHKEDGYHGCRGDGKGLQRMALLNDGESVAADSLVYSYHRSFNGFAAWLTHSQQHELSGYEGVVSVFPSERKKLHTTRSWDFLGFPQNVTRATVESDIVIGMLDTGIWPESQSFNDSGYGPPPQKWKGICQSSSNFTCNNKIIGARYYHAGRNFTNGDIPSPRDSQGHGSHTASTAAGNLVTPASLLGLASGTARGGVPSARIAVYKICWADVGCHGADILAAFDDAIADGVDIISLSVGGSFARDYFLDPIAIGAFHSMKNGILTSNSAGNEGAAPGSISNCSPWSLSVGASTTDRKFTTGLKLGNGKFYQGISLNTFEPSRVYPLIHAVDAQNKTAGHSSRYCDPGSLDKSLVEGKIVLCDNVGEGVEPLRAGATGSIMTLSYTEDDAYPFPLPVSILTDAEGADIVDYIHSTSDPTAQIFNTHDFIDNSSAYVISFSSRGPNPITRDILKPDLTAPGVDILAAWSGATTVTGLAEDTRVVPYNIISGTSMSCPHATAAAAYVKSFHPTWSPAALKSALMTTAHPISVKDIPDAEFGYGSGQIDPVRAADPGLVYDAGEFDYVRMLCGQGYNITQLRLVTGDHIHTACSEATNGTVWDLNYPSFALSSENPKTSITRVFHRTVTNVGPALSTYKPLVETPVGLNVHIEPEVLTFGSIGEKQSFVVTVTALLGRTTFSGSLTYIVYMGSHSHGEVAATEIHSNILEQVVGRGGSDFMLYSYKRSFSGFAAMLTSEEVRKLSGLEGVISVFPNEKIQLHTTRSWTFIGLSGKSERRQLESDIVVGMFDTGVWPESKSFSDEGFGPPPKKWKGGCIKSENFTCNNKIIGAKYYRISKNFTSDVASPRDTEGHGSHTASTAAGNFVPKASLEGLGLGTARGGVPSARIAVYKVCWADGCNDADVLAAFDDAIADGVDIISASMGGAKPRGYFTDSIAIGSFHAMQHGILTSTSAGNAGPKPKTVFNVAPWLLSVAASSIDRKFITKVQLGNGASYEGVSLNTINLHPTMYPVIYGGLAPKLKRPNVTAARQCLKGSLERRLVKGKIVLCDLIGSGESVSAAGGKGAIMQDNRSNEVAFSFAVPAAHVGQDIGSKISAYLKQTKNATATLFKSTHRRDESAPFIVKFSSRGPNAINEDILKPDIAAPGSDILAAWSPATTVTGLMGDKRVTEYNMLSGTSMACPHATAMPMRRTKNPDAEFAYGSGLINPRKAVDPGLVYDASEENYLHFLCGQGYNSTQMQVIAGKDIRCSNEKKLAIWDLNYPSFTLSSKPRGTVTRVFHRTLTNVGTHACSYIAETKTPKELVIKVTPEVLFFQSDGESKAFTMQHLSIIGDVAQMVERPLCMRETLLVLLTVLSHFFINHNAASDDTRQVHIVYMGDIPKSTTATLISTAEVHTNILHQALGRDDAADSIVYSYRKSFNGFAAMLTADEVQKLTRMEGVVSVFPSGKKELHTTKSWSYVGLHEQVERRPTEGEIIVGVLDSGIWPESESFSDEGFGPPPQKWKGTCTGSNFTCNNKIIGARYYKSTGNLVGNEVKSPRDTNGHGSHTASIAAGNLVSKASMKGLGKGTARGAVPSARIAVYKVCWSNGCQEADILAAFDDAISDGVDLISVSIGGSYAIDYFKDSIAIGSFHAMKKGILTSQSAGNSGPGPGTVDSVAPWALSVAAATIDRKYVTKVKLGNGNSFEGASINTVDLSNKMYPVIYGGNAPNVTGHFNTSSSKDCISDSLNKAKVKGHIVLCDSVNTGQSPSAAKAVGSIMLAQEDQAVAFNFPVPSSVVSGPDISRYVTETRNPKATIFRTVEKKSEAASFVVGFSSRGPNVILPDLLKPDIAAPGVDILGAYSEANTVTGTIGDKRVVSYNIISGTSMACPHATGAAAYIKSFHPKWSPAALRSALMTTATKLKPASNPEAEFAYGSGLINLDRAVDPGLIYDARERDYIELLCGQGYNGTEIRLITGEHVDCSKVDKLSVWNLNYPSFTVSGKPGTTVKGVFRRTVTNVGNSHSKYKAKVIKSSEELTMKVNPEFLHFESVGQKLSFRVTVEVKLKQSGIVSGALIWSDGSHDVRSPVIAHIL